MATCSKPSKVIKYEGEIYFPKEIQACDLRLRHLLWCCGQTRRLVGIDTDISSGNITVTAYGMDTLTFEGSSSLLVYDKFDDIIIKELEKKDEGIKVSDLRVFRFRGNIFVRVANHKDSFLNLNTRIMVTLEPDTVVEPIKLEIEVEELI